MKNNAASNITFTWTICRAAAQEQQHMVSLAGMVYFEVYLDEKGCVLKHGYMSQVVLIL